MGIFSLLGEQLRELARQHEVSQGLRLASDTRIRERALALPLDVLLVGATGAGKSSTINALASTYLAAVGEGVDPETRSLASYSLSSLLRLHDSPGLGESPAADARHARSLRQVLMQPGNAGSDLALIDVVLVVLDGSSRDLGTPLQVLEQAVLPVMPAAQVVLAINQADRALKGRHWDEEGNRPKAELDRRLEEMAASVQRRLRLSTGQEIARPVCYSAARRHNLAALMDRIIDSIPEQRRRVRGRC